MIGAGLIRNIGAAITAVYSTLAATGGAALVGFVQSGAGAAARTLQGKARERVTPDDFGATGDGVADDSAAVAAAIVASDSLTGGGTGKTYLSGALTLGASLRMSFVKLLGKAGLAAFVSIPAAASRVRLVDANVEAPAGTAFNMNEANASNTLILGSRIKGDSYAVLVNSGASGSDGVTIIGSEIESYKADGIEFNTFNEDVYNVSVIGNAIYTGAGSASAASGFAVGVAGTQGHITALNHVRRARNNAFHYEDAQVRGICALNTVQAALFGGVTVQAPAAGTPEGVSVLGNRIQHSGTTADGYAGVWTIGDANGSVAANIISGNYVRDFQYGYRLDGSSFQAGSNNVAHDCDVMVKLGAGAALGTFNGRGTITTLAEVAGLGIVGKVAYQGNPTNVLTRAGAGGPGGIVKGFLVSLNLAHAGAGATQAIDLCTLPTRFAGRVTLIHASGSTGAFYTAEVKWDGTTLTISNALPKHSGTLSGTTLVAAGGKLQVSFASTSAYNGSAKLDFDGVWYQE